MGGSRRRSFARIGVPGILAALIAAGGVPAANVVTNGDFSDGDSSWGVYPNGSPAFEFFFGEARIDANAGGSNVQFYQGQLGLLGGTQYKLRFDGRNTRGDDVRVSLLKDAAPYTNYGLAQIAHLTTVSKVHVFEFTTTPGDKTDARFQFWLAPYDDDGTTFYFDDISLRKVVP